MKRSYKRILSSVLAAAMTVASVTFLPTGTFAAEATITRIGGWYETIYAEWKDTNPDSTAVKVGYKLSSAGSYVYLTDTENNAEYTNLIRKKDNSTGRVDIPGLKPGTYDVSITDSSGNTKITKGIVVKAYDRSGFAHLQDSYSPTPAEKNPAQYTKSHKVEPYVGGVGAYNDDGTLKANAKVIYVTEATKNTVSVQDPVTGKTVTGIGNILNSRSDSNQTASETGLLKNFASKDIPLVIRFIGNVEAGDSNTSDNPPAVNVNGLTDYDSTGNGGSRGDDGMMARMRDPKNITIEGIGTDAQLTGWGIHGIASGQSEQKYGKSIEVRNLAFLHFPEDALGFEGNDQTSANRKLDDYQYAEFPVERVWVHNCTFYAGYCANPTDSDKSEGDGSCDFKRGTNFTLSYCSFSDSHKTNLIGSSSGVIQTNISMHHNYYRNVGARLPMTRQSNIHFYNNYVNNANPSVELTATIDARNDAYVFSQANYYNTCKYPLYTKQEGGSRGTIKSFEDVIYNPTYEDYTNVTFATDRNQKVDGKNLYQNFDTADFNNPTNNIYITDAVTAKNEAMAYAGAMPLDPPVVKEESVFPDLPNLGNIAVPQTIDYADSSSSDFFGNKMTAAGLTKLGSNTTTIVGNIAYKPTSNVSSTSANGMKGKDNIIVFKVASSTDVEMTEGSGTVSPALYDVNGKAYIIGSGKATVPAGTYVIQAVNSQKQAIINKLVFTSNNGEIVTQGTTEKSTESTTAKVEGGDKDTESTTEDLGGEVVPPPTGDNVINRDMLITKKLNTGYVTIQGSDGSSSDDFWRINKATKGNNYANYIMINLGKKAKVSIRSGNNKDILFTTDMSNTSDILIKVPNTTGTKEVPAGTYYIYNTGGNMNIYSIDVKIIEDSEYEEGYTTTTEATTEATTEETTEATTAAPVEGAVVLSLGSPTAAAGGNVTVPLKASGIDVIGAYTVTLDYKTADLTYVSAEDVAFKSGGKSSFKANDDSDNGLLKISAVNGDDITINKEGAVLCNIVFKANSSSDIKLSVDEIYGKDAAEIEHVTAQSGSVTVDDVDTELQTMQGDADNNGKVEQIDAYIVLKHISNVAKITDLVCYANADANKDNKVDMADVIWILSHIAGSTNPPTPGTTETSTETTTAEVENPVVNSSVFKTGDVFTYMPVGGVPTKTKVCEQDDVLIDDDNIKVVAAQPLMFVEGNATIEGKTTNKGEIKPANTTNTSIGGTNYRLIIAVTAKKASTVGFALKIGANNKTAVILEKVDVSGGTANVKVSENNSTSSSILKIVSTKLNAGETIYLAGIGTDLDFYGIDVSSDGGGVEPQPQVTEKPAESTTLNIDGATVIPEGDVSSLRSALSSAKAGDTIVLEEGTYDMGDRLNIGTSGSADKHITLTSDGMAVLDFKGEASTNPGKPGLNILKGVQYVDISNITCKNAPDNGMNVKGQHINITNCVFEGNGDTGCQISGESNKPRSEWPSDIIVKNCTSFNNIQPENADGFAAKLAVGDGVVFDGCIAYCNSDDGWDLFAKPESEGYGALGAITIKNCVAFNNGFLTNGEQEPNGDRNGFKLGGSGIGSPHVVENCIAFNNGAGGFVDNSNPDLKSLTNCTSYKNGQIETSKLNYAVYNARGISLTNCISYGHDKADNMTSAVVKNSVFYNSGYRLCNGTLSRDNVKNQTSYSISDADFESVKLPYTDLLKVHEQMRNADGSINMKGFLQPTSSGKLKGMGAKF